MKKRSSVRKIHRAAHLFLFGLACALSLNVPLLFPPQNTYAQTKFGGLHVTTIVCTCSGNLLLYIQDFATNNFLSLVYQPGASLLYSFYNVYASYMLGSYTPGAGQCQIVSGPSCTNLSSDGQLDAMPGTGTSGS